ncbi:MAG: ribosome silencing factor [Chlamydiota bacterium]|nr:ribosome silencing factor [Chlamydiota bacterium]
MIDSSLELLNAIAQAIFDKNGSNILALDVRNTSSMADYVLIAEGNVDRHVIAIGKKVVEAAKKIGSDPYMIEGEKHGDWLIIDFVDVIVHIFLSDVREIYELEELWRDSKIVDLDIIVPNDRNENE